MDSDRLPVRPTPQRLLLYLALIALCLCVACAEIISIFVTNNPFHAALGVFFLIGAVLFARPLVNAWRRNGSFTVLVLTPHGMEIHGGLVPWEDVAKVGSATHNARSNRPRFFGVTLRDFTRFLGSIEAHHPRRATRLRREMRRSHGASGWDLVVSPLLLDRPLSDFVTLVQNYWIRYRPGDLPGQSE